jgi:hypothetical protein
VFSNVINSYRKIPSHKLLIDLKCKKDYTVFNNVINSYQKISSQVNFDFLCNKEMKIRIRNPTPQPASVHLK